MAIDLSFLEEYSQEEQSEIRSLMEEGKLESYINARYPEKHDIITDKALFTYTQGIRKKYMKKCPPAHKVVFDDKNETAYNALGDKDNELILTDNGHKIKNVMRIASLFKTAPAELFYMVVVHELAHLKDREHSRNFYRLCEHMDNDYYEHENDLKLYLISQGY